ncbi:ATP-binding protein [Bacillus cereus]|nr:MULTISPECIES: ATP-binding protein [Bacillus]UBR29498.1 sensor histidine kinase [Bacillus sp. SD-4]MCX9102379.1 ATP-binding protein [Bacillus anthracis]MDA1741123.1 ATP-binding protein [Bacillus cereus]MDA1757618.1 ATP-binding protein [Bacillus cereus]MDA2040538.1 ATP-binding protein [Bacillus cereus]
MYFHFGMENEKLDKIGKAFYTTKQNGTGLRLVITYKVIEEYQGSVVIQSSVEIGTKVEIFLMIV